MCLISREVPPPEEIELFYFQTPISDLHPYHHPKPYLTAAERKKNLACGAHQRFVFSTGSGPSYCDVSLPPGVRPGITNCALVTFQCGVEVGKVLQKFHQDILVKTDMFGIFLCFRGLFGCPGDSIMGGNWNAFSFFGFEQKIVPPFFELGCDIPNWSKAKWVFESLTLEHMDGTEPCHKPIHESRADARFQFLKHLPSTVQDQDCQKTSPRNRKPYFQAIVVLVKVTKHV